MKLELESMQKKLNACDSIHLLTVKDLTDTQVKLTKSLHELEISGKEKEH